MDGNRNDDFSLPVFIDASKEAYYQMSQMEKQVEGVKHRYPELLRWHATPEEMSTLMGLGMKLNYQKGGLIVTLIYAFYDKNNSVPISLKVEKKLVHGVRVRFPNLFRRHATPQEMPTLIGLGMKPSYYQRSKLVVTLVKKNEIDDILEGRTEKYKAVPRSKKLLICAGSETMAPHTEELKKPPFTILQLVSQALLSLENSGLTTRKVADWVSNTYPYYQSIEKFRWKRASDVLSRSNFFTQKHSRVWYIVQKYETQLRKSAYLPCGGKIERTRHGRFKSPLHQSEVLDIISLIDDDVTAVDTSPPQKIKPEVLDIIDLVGNDVTAIDASPPQRIKSELLDNINLIENDVTAADASSSKEIKWEVLDIIDLVEDDENEFGCEAINTSHHLECKTNPIEFPITNDSIDSANGKMDIQCPICEEQFSTNEALGEHVGAHRRMPTDANEIARAALQNITTSLCGRNPELPIFVFSGNVYLNTKNSATP